MILTIYIISHIKRHLIQKSLDFVFIATDESFLFN